MYGFSLIEMAMVLAIIGLVMGSVLALTKTLTTSSRLTSTITKESIIKAALINFIAINNRLPYPADPTAITTSTAGTEASGLSPFGSVPNKVVTGLVPWSALGLTQDAATDGYYNLFTYQVSLTATQTVAVTAAASGKQTISGLEGAIKILNSAGGTQINDCTPAGFTYNPCSAVTVIISYGQSGYGAYTANGSGLKNPVPSGYTDETENANGNNIFVMKDASISTTNPFDDIVLPLNANNLLSPLITNGSVQTYNAVLNNDFANIEASITAYAISNRINGNYCYNNGHYNGDNQYQLPSGNGGIPSIVGLNIPPSVAYDPWGNPIQYYPTTTSIVVCTNTSNPAYKLTSYGPDGILGNADDISVTIFVNQLQPAFTISGW